MRLTFRFMISCRLASAATTRVCILAGMLATIRLMQAFPKMRRLEQRANPSMASWGNDGYLAQQRKRLPDA